MFKIMLNMVYANLGFPLPPPLCQLSVRDVSALLCADIFKTPSYFYNEGLIYFFVPKLSGVVSAIGVKCHRFVFRNENAGSG